MKLHSYVVIELKTGEFRAEYVSKLGLYVTAVNHQVKHQMDNNTIGLLICKTKDEVVARYALETLSIFRVKNGTLTARYEKGKEKSSYNFM